MPDGFFPAYSTPVEIMPSSALVSMPSGTIKMSEVFYNYNIRASDVRLMLRGTVTGVPNVGGTVDLYLCTGLVDGTATMTDRISTTSAAGTTVSDVFYSRHITSIQVQNVSGTSFSWEDSLLDYVGCMPAVWRILIANRTGAQFSAVTADNTFHAAFINYGYA